MSIGNLGEKSLHAALKQYLAQPGDQIEHPVGGYVVDIARDDLLIEIQTRNFAKLKTKLNRLLNDHPFHLVHPIASARWIVRQDKTGVQISRRKSPKKGTLLELFRELVYIPHMINHPHFSLEVVLVHEEQIWRDDKMGSWRRKKWSIIDRRLLLVEARHVFRSPADLAALLPDDLPEQFTTRNLPRAYAQKMAYALREMGAITYVGKQGRAYLYQRGR